MVDWWRYGAAARSPGAGRLDCCGAQANAGGFVPAEPGGGPPRLPDGVCPVPDGERSRPQRPVPAGTGTSLEAVVAVEEVGLARNPAYLQISFFASAYRFFDLRAGPLARDT